MRDFDVVLRVTGGYQLFLLALRGRYLSIMAPGVEVTPAALRDLQSDAYRLAETHLEMASRDLSAHVASLELADAATLSKVGQRMEALLAELRRILVENVKSIVTQARTGQGNLADLLTQPAGAFGLLVQRKLSDAEFSVHDSSGRRWNAMSLVRLLVRDFAYQSWIDSEVADLIAAGHELAEAVYQDGRPPVRFVIAGPRLDHPSLAEVRKSVFHINATAAVSHVPS